MAESHGFMQAMNRAAKLLRQGRLQEKKLQKEKPFACNAMHVMVKQEGRRVDALALRADERRDKLRKASGRSKYPSIRRYLNGETRLERLQSSCNEQNSCRRGTR